MDIDDVLVPAGVYASSGKYNHQGIKGLYGGWIGCDHMDSKSMQPGATPGLSAR